MNRHTLIFGLIWITALLLSSCSNEPECTYRIGVAQCSSDAWRTKLNEEMERELLFHPGLTLEVRSANDDNVQQAADIDYFINQHVDLLVVSPNKAVSLTPAVSKAYDAGIPVIVADRKVTGEKYTAFIGGDNLAVGHLMAQYLKMQLPHGGKVLEVMGLPGSTPAELRHQGLMEELGATGDETTVGGYEFIQCTGNWFRDQGKAAVEEILHQHADIDMILAQNDLMAIGAREALEHLQPQRHVIIMGVDGLTGKGNGVEAIAQGRVDASAVYSTGGDLIIQTAVRILEGKPYERNTNLATYLIDAETAPLMNNIYKEVDHQVETVQMLKGRVDYYWQQHNLEQTLLYTLLCIVVLVIIFIIVLYLNYNQKQRLNESLARQKNMMKEQRDQLAAQNTQLTQLTEELEEATRAKLLFFTNVSHDFRTPLTLINGPIEQLLKMEGKDNPSESRTELLRLAHKNVQVLLRLVNQILDFRKYESGKLEINLIPIDLRKEMTGWNESFQGLAHQKHVRLTLDIEGGDDERAFEMQADLAKVERIFFNLIGNAFKFTPENGRIAVTLRRQDDTIVMRIADTGPGIPVEHIQKIFDNFYQVDSAHHEGSGIGLALVKSFVELHGGTITVANQETGTGSVFTVTLPFRPITETLDQQELRRATTLTPECIETELAEVQTEDEIAENEPKRIVLVIDDNPDIRTYMHTLLSGEYRVINAANGQEGIRRAMTMVPDAIICDVMMPGMDGIECCNRLKHEVNTCHIPVLMLTACSLDEQRVKGLSEGGADAYMSKPFSADVLLAQIASLIKNHNRVRDFFRDSFAEKAEPVAGSKANAERDGAKSQGSTEGGKDATSQPREVAGNLDDKFLQRVRQIIDQHLADETFGVEMLGDEIGMSRAQLYRKCKALTNYSPVELIRNTRLKRAQKMLAQGNETIAQVAYQVGFTAPSYFTKCYKEYFGENPIELVKRKG